MKRLFTIEAWQAYTGQPRRAVQIGDRLTVNRFYEGSKHKAGVTFTVIGRLTGGDVNDSLEALGFEGHEVFKGRFDDGSIAHIWPNEVNFGGTK